MNQIKLSKRK